MTVSPESEVADFHLPTTRDAVIDNLVHELRQPLSVIESLAYYLELTTKDHNACSHLQQIQAMVEQANRILSKSRES